MGSTGGKRADVKKLIGRENYQQWKPLAMAYLITEKVWTAVDPARPVPSGVVALGKWQEKDEAAFGELYLLCGEDVQAELNELEDRSGRAVWKFLMDEYEVDSPTSRMALRTEFYNTNHSGLTPVSCYITKLKSLVRQLRAINVQLSPDELFDKLLIGLPECYRPIRQILLNHGITPKFADACASIKDYERTELDKVDSVISLAARAGQSLARFKDFDWGNTKGRPGVCFRCGVSGHIAQFCVADMPEEVKQRILLHSVADQAKAQSNVAQEVPKVQEVQEYVGAAFTSPSPVPSLSINRRGGQRGGRRSDTTAQVLFTDQGSPNPTGVDYDSDELSL